MPTQTVNDPLNYTAIFTPGGQTWHDGTGMITVTYLTTIPDIYVSGGGFDVLGTSFAPGTDPSLSTAQLAAAQLAVTRLGEVASLGFTEVAQSATPPTFGTPITGDGTLVTGLGGAAGFGEIAVPRTDDGYFVYDISSVFSGGLNVFGNSFTDMFVNANGSISFGNGVLSYTPYALEYAYAPIFAPFWADIDTRGGALAGLESGQIHVDLDAANGIVTITWDHVNFYDRNGTKQNSFQIQIYDRLNGDFDVVYRYEAIDWTAGDASGGSDGLGGWAAVAGVAAGDGSAPLKLPGSGVQGMMRTLDTRTGNTGQTGLWVIESRGGAVSLATPPAPGAPGVGDVTFGALDFGSSRQAFLERGPGTGSFAGDLWINTGNSLTADLTAGSRGFAKLLQSLGRVSGMELTKKSAVLSSALDTQQYTVMSDTLAAAQAALPAGQRVAPSTPQLFDIQALQIMYGPNMNTRAGDDVYFAAGGNTPFTIADGGALVATIWDAGGRDSFDASDQSSRVVIDLRPGKFSSIGRLKDNIAIALGVPGERAMSAIIEDAIGGSGADKLTGNSSANKLVGNGGADLLIGQAGNDQLKGNSGADTLRGGQGDDVLRGGKGADRLSGDAGNDQLYGGPGADIFVFDGNPGADRVADYTDADDRIDIGDLGVAFTDLVFQDLAAGRVRIQAAGKSFLLIDTDHTLTSAD
ncbi:MAG: hypothetical protein D6754_17015, partial [Alphaproteobacteria bacterium]